MNRSSFIRNLGAGMLAAASLPLAAHTFRQEDPQVDRSLVQKFVGAAHRDMETVKALLVEHPTLLNAAHDWKYGDFETALGAASHVGYKELAAYLIEQGAQFNIFTAALFGRLDILKPILDLYPQTLYAKGPHGFTLLHHAQKGGEEARPVAELLQSLGATETKVALYGKDTRYSRYSVMTSFFRVFR